MKKLLFVSLLMSILFSCSNDDDTGNAFIADQFPQKWQLIEMTGSIADMPPLTGDNLEWQESYLLQSDNTFIKSRERDNVTTEAKGAFTIKSDAGGSFAELTYETENSLIENCSVELKEIMRFNSVNRMSGISQACDGPGLLYERIE